MVLREVLHAHIPTLTEASTVRDAVDRMDVYQFPALVIVDGERRPLAVVTEGDLCRAAARRDSVLSLANDPALAHGSAHPTTATPDMEIGDALHRMLSSGLTVLPIVDGPPERGVLAGIVLRVDLMQAMLADAAS